MFSEGTKVKISSNSDWEPNGVGIIVESESFANYSTVLFGDERLAIRNVHITPITLGLDEVDRWPLPTLKIAEEDEVEIIDISLRHTLSIKGHMHLLTTKEIKDLKNVLAAIV